MNKESTELILQHLDKLGEKLGVAADKIWPWFIKQVYVEAAVSTVAFLIVCAITYFFFKFLFKHWAPDRDSKIYSITRSNHESAYFFMGALLSIPITLLFFYFIYDVPKIFNIEYHALVNLINHIK